MSKKIYPTAVLKNLPPQKQAAIVEYLDGNAEAGVKAHSICATVEWLLADGITTSTCALSEFRSWWLLRRQLELNEMAAKEMIAEGKAQGWIKTADEEQAAGQVFFTRLAMQQNDNLGFVRILREQTRHKLLAVQERRLAMLEDQHAKTKEVVADTKLSPEEKQQRIRQILGTE